MIGSTILAHFFNRMSMSMGIHKEKSTRLYRLKLRGVNSVLAQAASLMLTGIPPIVCESVLDGICSTVRKSIENRFL